MSEGVFDIVIGGYVNAVNAIGQGPADVSLDVLVSANAMMGLMVQQWPMVRSVLERVHAVAQQKPDDQELKPYLQETLSNPNTLMSIGLEAFQKKSKEENILLKLPNPASISTLQLVLQVNNLLDYIMYSGFSIVDVSSSDPLLKDTSPAASTLRAIRELIIEEGGEEMFKKLTTSQKRRAVAHSVGAALSEFAK
jgi:hypothetical protein